MSTERVVRRFYFLGECDRRQTRSLVSRLTVMAERSVGWIIGYEFKCWPQALS